MPGPKRADFQAKGFPCPCPGGLFVPSLHSACPCPASSPLVELVALCPRGQGRVHRTRTCYSPGAFPVGLGEDGGLFHTPDSTLAMAGCCPTPAPQCSNLHLSLGATENTRQQKTHFPIVQKWVLFSAKRQQDWSQREPHSCRYSTPTLSGGGTGRWQSGAGCPQAGHDREAHWRWHTLEGDVRVTVFPCSWATRLLKDSTVIPSARGEAMAATCMCVNIYIYMSIYRYL